MFLGSIVDWLHVFWLQLGLTTLFGPVSFFLVLERLFPGEAGQSLASVWDNLKVSLVSKLITTAYAGLVATLFALLMRPFHSGLLDLRFATQGSFALDLLAALLWFLVFDFFIIGSIGRSTHCLGCGRNTACITARRR